LQSAYSIRPNYISKTTAKAPAAQGKHKVMIVSLGMPFFEHGSGFVLYFTMAHNTTQGGFSSSISNGAFFFMLWK
jgi:hypothetical protein